MWPPPWRNPPEVWRWHHQTRHRIVGSVSSLKAAGWLLKSTKFSLNFVRFVVEGAVEPHLGPCFAQSQKSPLHGYQLLTQPQFHPNFTPRWREKLGRVPRAAIAMVEADPWLCKVKLFCRLCPLGCFSAPLSPVKFRVTAGALFCSSTSTLLHRVLRWTGMQDEERPGWFLQLLHEPSVLWTTWWCLNIWIRLGLF